MIITASVQLRKSLVVSLKGLGGLSQHGRTRCLESNMGPPTYKNHSMVKFGFQLTYITAATLVNLESNQHY
jgi:hypothetical protein